MKVGGGIRAGSSLGVGGVKVGPVWGLVGLNGIEVRAGGIHIRGW